MKKKNVFCSFTLLISLITLSQTGPNYVKNSLINQRVFNNPTFEFTTEFDNQKDSNNRQTQFLKFIKE